MIIPIANESKIHFREDLDNLQTADIIENGRIEDGIVIDDHNTNNFEKALAISVASCTLLVAILMLGMTFYHFFNQHI